MSRLGFSLTSRAAHVRLTPAQACHGIMVSAPANLLIRRLRISMPINLSGAIYGGHRSGLRASATIPSDHGYALYSAICRTLERRQDPPRPAAAGRGAGGEGPADHTAVGRTRAAAAPLRLDRETPQRPDGHWSIGIHPVNGQYIGSRQLQLTETSRLRVRVATDLIPHCLVLAGKQLDLAGHRIRVGVPTVHALTPAATLMSRLVIIKGFTEPATFLAAVRRQLDLLGISPAAELSIPRFRTGHFAGEPRRRVLRIKDKKVVGFPLFITGLTAEESLRLQEHDGIRAPGDPDKFIVPPLGLGGRRTMGCGIFVPVGPLPW